MICLRQTMKISLSPSPLQYLKLHAGILPNLHKWIINVSNMLFSVGYLEPRVLWFINSENSLSRILFLFSIRELASPPTRYLRSGVADVIALIVSSFPLFRFV